jgi:hypothetical protein
MKSPLFALFVTLVCIVFLRYSGASYWGGVLLGANAMAMFIMVIHDWNKIGEK